MSVTLIIVVITCAVSFLAFNNRELFDRLKHHPYSENRNKEYSRFLTSGFVHGSFMHLAINMYVLYEFGQYVESVFVSAMGESIGRSAYLIMYLLTIVLADIPSYLKYKDNPRYAAIGASGGVSGILFSFILFNPWSMLGLYFIIPIPAIIFGVLYLVYSSWAANSNRQDGIGHDAHFFGALAGILLTMIMIPRAFPHFLDALTNNLPF